MLILGASELDLAAHLLCQGKLVAFPTETVYGLGARLADAEAIHSLFQVKGRPSDNPLIVHVQSLEEVEALAHEIPPLFYRLAEGFWPGPLTCILKARPGLSSPALAGLDSIALRWPAHPIACELIRRVASPLVAPSANRSGKPSPTCVAHVMEDFEGKIAAVVEGGVTEWGIESTVISLLGDQPMLLRPGSITQAALEAVLGSPLMQASAQEVRRSPGMRYRHYAPACPLLLIPTWDELEERLLLAPARRTVLSHAPLALNVPNTEFHTLAAANLYARLRASDQRGDQEILVLWEMPLQEDAALSNRLMRATSGAILASNSSHSR
jgi:L-threonylcarbamoyladenylate synthase